MIIKRKNYYLITIAQSIKIKEILGESSVGVLFAISASIKFTASCPFVADKVGYPSFAN